MMQRRRGGRSRRGSRGAGGSLAALFAVNLAVAGARGASAHDFWIEPSTPRPAVGERVALQLRVGERLLGDPVPRNPLAIVRFDLVSPGGVRKAIPGDAGVAPAGAFTAASSGSNWIVFENYPTAVEVSPQIFAEYLEKEGLEKVEAERQKRGEGEKPGREAFSRSAKAALCVGTSAGTPSHESASAAPLGLALELLPESDPCLWRAGVKTKLKLLFHGKPLEGALVQALRSDLANGAERKEPADPPVAARTDKNGRVELELGRAGFWLIKAVEARRTTEIPDIDWESVWASLTVELPAP